MKFYGREKEIKRLTDTLKKPSLQVSLIYGRRRIGKSELIKKTLQELDFQNIYYECKETSELNNIESLAEVISQNLGLPPLKFNSIEKLLEFLFENYKKSPLILVLDEYQYLRSCVQGLDSILKSQIDKYRSCTEIKLILCGSYIDIMASLLEEFNPLFGRIDNVILLEAMDYYDSAKFYQNYSNIEKVQLYSVFGGVPYYNSLIDTSKSVEENIIDLVSSSGARLENEVIAYLKQEISRISNANQTIEAIAKGYCKFSDILSQSYVGSSPTLVDVLNKLIRMGLVEKKTPINDENNKRKAKYYISDNLSHFYYRYMYRYLSQMKIMNPNVFFNKFIKNDFYSKYVPYIFESICKEFLIRQNINAQLPDTFYKIGSYYYDDVQNHKNGEFDIVTQDDNGYVFYEAKFKNEPLLQKDINKEIAQVNATSLKAYKYGFFSKVGYADDIKATNDLVLYTLDNLYE